MGYAFGHGSRGVCSCTGINEKKTSLKRLLNTRAVLRVIPIETWRRMGYDKDDLLGSRIRLSAANKGALGVHGRTPRKAWSLGERNLCMSFLVVENLDDSNNFILAGTLPERLM